MCTMCLGMLLGLSHLRMAGWGGIYSSQPQFYQLDKKQQLSVVGCTGQSGAPPDMHCAVSSARHVSQPLASIVVDRWIWPLPNYPVHIGQSGATARGRLSVAPLRRLSGCPTGQSGAPPGADWQPFSRVFLLIPSGLFCSWVFDFYASFYVSFWGVASLLPKSNPLRILWTTIRNSSKHISPQIVLIIKHQTH
jgi:hypothetical protein